MPIRRERIVVPCEWENYLVQSPHALEVVPWYLFHRKRFADPHQMHFFGDVPYNDLGQTDEDTNMVIPGMLPNPCSYLIEGIRIFGLPSSLINARIIMHIGNKRMVDTNVLAYIERWKMRDIALMIAPMQCFQVILRWKQPHVFGFDRVPLITIMFKGQMARAAC